MSAGLPPAETLPFNRERRGKPQEHMLLNRKEAQTMYEIAWQEFDRNDRIVTKRKAFKTEEGRAKFIERISYKASFYCILATRDPDCHW